MVLQLLTVTNLARGCEGIGEDRSKDGRYAWCQVLASVPEDPFAPLALPGAAFVPYAGAVPDGGRHGFEAARTVAKPPSSSGLGHRPFKAAARVRIPLG